MSEGASRSEIGSESRIAELNDAFRRSFSGGKVLLTAGVHELPDMVKAEALHLVATYDKFDARSDPHGERDFGSFELVGRTFFWKIDYYDARTQQGSEDASDPEKTLRVLTLMLAHEY
jgi:hypothetical protein